MPAIVTIGNGPSSGDGTYINAADLAAQLAAGAVAIAADASIVIETSVDLSLFAGSTVAGNLTLQAPNIHVSGNVQVGTGSVILNATSLALGGTFSSDGSPLPGARLTGTATSVSVLSDAANIQQAIDASNFNTPVTINVASGDYVGAVTVSHALSLIGAPAAAGVGANASAPRLTFNPATGGDLISVQVANVTISGFVLDATGSSGPTNGIGGTAINLDITTNNFIGFSFAGVLHLFANDVLIQANYFERIQSDAIREVAGAGVVVRGNVVEGNAAGEFGAGRYGIFVGDSFGAQIVDNVVRGVNGGAGAGQVGIYSFNVDGGVISGNVVAGLSGGRGSFLHDYDFSRTDGATITNNTVDSDGNAGSIAAGQTNIMTPAFAAFREDTGVSGDGVSNNGLIDVTLAPTATSWRYSTDGGATWTVGVGASFTLAAGTYAAGAIQVDQSDANGNTNSAYQLGAITVLDEALPPPTAALSQDTGISGTDGITSRDLINVTLAAEAVTWQYSTDGGSTWILGQGDSFALPEGVYEAGFVRVRQADATGVYGESFGLGAVTIDQTVGSPFATLFRDTGVDGDGLTANPLVTVNLAGDVLTWRYSTDGSATWTAGVGTTSWNAGSGAHFFLTDGVYSAGTILVEQTDIAGNVSSPFALSPITVDLQPPTISGSLANDTGSQGDGITSDGRINVSFSAGTTLWYYSIDGGANWTTVTDTSVRSFVVPIGVYSPGSVQLLATEVTGLQSDAFSIAGPIIVLAAPTASVAISAISEDTGTVGDFITSDRTLTVSGSNSALGAFERIEISTDDGATWANVTMTQDGLGWSYVDSVTHNTNFTYTVRAVNAAGGVGNSVSQGITILNGVILTGTAGSNTLTGTEFSDTLRGLAGADTLIGGRGNDLLDGGADNDRFLYTIGDGGDTIIGGAGTDRLIITDTAGPDFLQVTVVGNRITGINDNSSGLMGTISGVEIVNLTVTGPGDFLNYGPSLGPITVDLQTRTATGFTTITGLQNVQGGFGDDRLFGNASDNLIYGGNGADRIEGRRGNDTMSGLEGNDTLVYNVGDGDDYIDGGEGIDTLQILGTASADRVDISLINWFTGPAVFRLQGGYVDPTMEVVTLNMGDGVDTLSYASTASPSAVAVTVNLQAATATGITSIAGVENVVGGNGADTLIGNGANNQLSGGAGADVLRGFGGNDVLTGGGGDDTLSGGVGNDRFVFRSGDGRDTITDFVAGAASGDTIQLLGYGPNLDSFAEVRAATFQVGANTVIDLGNGELITLIGVNAATLNAGDFVFGP